MNAIGLDFGTKNIGIALAINGIITPYATLENNLSFFSKLQKIIDEYQITHLYLGMSEGKIAELAKEFATRLKQAISLPLEIVNESISTIEAQNYVKTTSKKYHQKIDAISAAVILKRVL